MAPSHAQAPTGLMVHQMCVQSKEAAQGCKGNATAAKRSRGNSVHASTPVDGAAPVDDDFEILDDEWNGTPVTGAITTIASGTSSSIDAAVLVMPQAN